MLGSRKNSEASLPKVVIAQGKMLENRADSHKSATRFVRRLFERKTHWLKKDNTANMKNWHQLNL